eukprot:1982956-Alexandrium_andersonii.AAC.1
MNLISSARAAITSSGGRAAPAISSRNVRPADTGRPPPERSDPTPLGPTGSLCPVRAPPANADYPSWDRKVASVPRSGPT